MLVLEKKSNKKSAKPKYLDINSFSIFVISSIEYSVLDFDCLVLKIRSGVYLPGKRHGASWSDHLGSGPT